MRNRLFELEQEIARVKQQAGQSLSQTKDNYASDPLRNRLLALEQHQLQVKQAKLGKTNLTQGSATNKSLPAAHVVQMGRTNPIFAIQLGYAVDQNTYTELHLHNLRFKWEQAAYELVQALGEGKTIQLHKRTINPSKHQQTQAKQSAIKMPVEPQTQNSPSLIKNGKLNTTRMNQIMAKEYPDELAQQIVRGIPGVKQNEIREALKNYYIRNLNKEGWKKFSKTLDFGVNGKYESVFTPVNQEFDQEFKDYGETGISSMSDRLTDDPIKQFAYRPTNFWLTQYKTDQDNIIFEAFRSGTLSYSLNDKLIVIHFSKLIRL